MIDAPSYPDPLGMSRPPTAQPVTPTYWQATAGTAPDDDGRLESDLDCDVAIIGGGYTGLSCAYHLTKLRVASVAVIEANQPGWGCSGRNGSFARPAIGRVPHADWERKWGAEIADAMFAEALAALETARNVIQEADIDCDVMPEGWLKIAHRAGRVAALQREGDLLRNRYGMAVEFLDAKRLAAEHVACGDGYGALRWPLSFAMHPLKLVYGLVRAARGQGAVIFRDTPALGLDKDGGRHVISTPRGLVRARHLVISTNGYTVEGLFPKLRHRLLPVMSNIVVTRPMTLEEKQAGNFVTSDCMSDARTLLHYYRRLPDDRIMLGGKGPVRATPRQMAAHRQELLRVIERKFPFMKAPSVEYFWGGWVALTPDSLPHITTAEDDQSLHYALGYIGSGVSCSLHAGRRIAEKITGQQVSLPTPLTAALPKYPMAAFRRLGQRAAMKWYALKDERL
ncbi:FAD-binding oxidoreductase [Limibacillus sp. MBR-115]|uniref:NAD(P)/FAD-dependent oxidoreductase n=1 Tax=Limibacillus sp. MBR-115 TaxID=3156465 RepID=UPI003398435E